MEAVLDVASYVVTTTSGTRYGVYPIAGFNVFQVCRAEYVEGEPSVFLPIGLLDTMPAIPEIGAYWTICGWVTTKVRSVDVKIGAWSW